MTTENYVYKKEVDWSLLQEGLTLPFDNQVIFGQVRCTLVEGLQKWTLKE